MKMRQVQKKGTVKDEKHKKTDTVPNSDYGNSLLFPDSMGRD